MLRERSFSACVAKAVSGFNFVEGFAVLCASHVSMASPFLGFCVLRTFQWLRRFSLRCFYGYAVSMPAAFDADAVSVASPFYVCGV